MKNNNGKKSPALGIVMIVLAAIIATLGVFVIGSSIGNPFLSILVRLVSLGLAAFFLVMGIRRLKGSRRRENAAPSYTPPKTYKQPERERQDAEEWRKRQTQQSAREAEEAKQKAAANAARKAANLEKALTLDRARQIILRALEDYFAKTEATKRQYGSYPPGRIFNYSVSIPGFEVAKGKNAVVIHFSLSCLFRAGFNTFTAEYHGKAQEELENSLYWNRKGKALESQGAHYGAQKAFSNEYSTSHSAQDLDRMSAFKRGAQNKIIDVVHDAIAPYLREYGYIKNGNQLAKSFVYHWDIRWVYEKNDRKNYAKSIANDNEYSRKTLDNDF